MEIRWLKKSDGTKILQYLEVRSYDDGCNHIDEISEWKDVPTMNEKDVEEGMTLLVIRTTLPES